MRWRGGWSRNARLCSAEGGASVNGDLLSVVPSSERGRKQRQGLENVRRDSGAAADL